MSAVPLTLPPSRIAATLQNHLPVSKPTHAAVTSKSLDEYHMPTYVGDENCPWSETKRKYYQSKAENGQLKPILDPDFHINECGFAL